MLPPGAGDQEAVQQSTQTIRGGQGKEKHTVERHSCIRSLIVYIPTDFFTITSWNHKKIRLQFVYADKWCPARESCWVYIVINVQALHSCHEESRHKEVKALKDEIRALQVRTQRKLSPQMSIITCYAWWTNSVFFTYNYMNYVLQLVAY